LLPQASTLSFLVRDIFYLFLVFIGRSLAIYIPKTIMDLVSNPDSLRTDIRLHDLYSFSIGLIVITLLSKPISFILPYLRKLIDPESKRNLMTFLLTKRRYGIFISKSELASHVSSWNRSIVWGVNKSLYYGWLALKTSYLMATVGVLIPFLFGLLVAQMSNVLRHGKVVLGWKDIEYQHLVLGIIFDRIFYSLIMLGIWPSVHLAINRV
jgi:hypothetical protein